MKQELRETSKQMIKDDNKEIEEILNKHPKGHYWIVVHHKITKMRLKSGEKVLIKLIKKYDKKPKDLVGTIILEVKDSEILKCNVSPHDIPVDWSKVEKHAGTKEYPTVFKNHPIAGSYIYQ